jgi:hypothetical protein
VTPAPTVVAAEASRPQELARTGMGLLGVELLLAASLMAVGALCLRHARRRTAPASWSPPELPFELWFPDLPVEPEPTETETVIAIATAPSDDARWDARPIPALAGVGERARGAPPTVASWLSRAGPPDDS